MMSQRWTTFQRNYKLASKYKFLATLLQFVYHICVTVSNWNLAPVGIIVFFIYMQSLISNLRKEKQKNFQCTILFPANAS
jgi:uncharacterized membrane protein